MRNRRKTAEHLTWEVAHTADSEFLEKFPSLKLYLDRVGAELTNFRRAVVREKSDSGYWHDVAVIRWKPQGEIECDNDAHAPTQAEKAAINAALSSGQIEWPVSVGATPLEVDDLRRQLSLGADDHSLYEFRDPKCERGRGFTVFVQQRIDNPEAISAHSKKVYRPWTFWSDGKWRAMEPDGKLPIFGLEQLTPDVGVVFLHEGAKAARHCQLLATDRTPEGRAARATHPWGEALFGTEGVEQAGYIVHLGWIGGATNPHRADLDRLLSLAPDVVVYVVCDNDQLGRKVIRELSRALKRKLLMVAFDGRFFDGFDLADPFFDPDDAWDRPFFLQRYQAKPDGEWAYVGPAFRDCVFPATWATRIIHTGSKGRPLVVVRDEFLREWRYVVEQDVFVHVANPRRLLNAKQFNNLNAPFSDIADLASKVVADESTHVDRICYRPGMNAGEINAPEGRLINTWAPTKLRRIPGKTDDEIAKLVEPFLRFCRHLIPDDADREHVLAFLATLAAHPEIRMRYALLLVSRMQGTGKGTLAGIASQLVGEHNASVPSENSILNSSFNGWAANVRLATVAEIHGGEPKKMYQRLMDVITDAKISVNIKFVADYTTENWLHIIACSNFRDALNIPDTDRRWFIPTVTEEVWPGEEWRAFYGWLESGGYDLIFEWAHRYTADGSRIVRTHNKAPMSGAKRTIIREGRSAGSQLAVELAERVAAQMRKQKGKVLFTIDDVQEWVAAMRGISDPTSRVLESPKTLRAALVEGGMFEPDRVPGTEQRRFTVPFVSTEGGKTTEKSGRTQYVVASFPITASMRWADVAQYKRDPRDFIAVKPRRI